jgi:hypothetical protein
MNTRESSKLFCKLCLYSVSFEDDYKFRFHYKSVHQISNIRINNYTFANEETNCRKNRNLKKKTVAKRRRVAKLMGCKNETPRQCAAIRKNGKQCSILVISPNSKLKVRCCHHLTYVAVNEKEKEIIQDQLKPVMKKTLAKRVRVARMKGCSVVKPRQCTAYRPNGSRCSICLISPEASSNVRCVHHPLKTIEFATSRGVFGTQLSYLTVKPSSVVGGGNGVFTTALGSFDEGDFITEFCGDHLSKEDYKASKHRREYTIECRDFQKPYISGLDYAKVGFGVGSLINKCDDKNLPNIKFVYRFAKTSRESVWVMATRRIVPNSELFTVYGNGFRILKPDDDSLM